MTDLARLLNAIYMLRRKVNSEETFLRRTLKARSFRGARLLDVGCGFGKLYEIIRSQGVEYVGVDVNPDIVEHNLNLQRVVYTDAQFCSTTDLFDVLLLSHLIEHFEYSDLVKFLNTHLSRLKQGGIIIIFTPLYHRGFYDDFDHIKPYNPEALRQLFCKSSKQTQEYGLRGEYVELDIWFKRDSVWHSHSTGKWKHIFSVPLSLACTFSYGLVGRRNGYGIVLKRVG
jgi:2-polyprenyl-3-methyl-5-hydroxy-6-metoxy-1,4-benzoquinol methylase